MVVSDIRNVGAMMETAMYNQDMDTTDWARAIVLVFKASMQIYFFDNKVGGGIVTTSARLSIKR